MYFLAFGYAVTGLLVAIPYCLLAGFSLKHYMIVAFIAPLCIVISYILASKIGVIFINEYHHLFSKRHIFSQLIFFDWRAAFDSRQYGVDSLVTFWVWHIVILSPIMFHWSSKIFTYLEYEGIAWFLESHRYASPIWVLIAIALCFAAVDMATDVSTLIGKTFKKT